MGISGNVCERLPAREGQPQALFEDSKNLASSFCEVRPEFTEQTMTPEMRMRREQQGLSSPKTFFTVEMEFLIILLELLLTVV